jgi:Fe-S oxidoreductase
LFIAARADIVEQEKTPQCVVEYKEQLLTQRGDTGKDFADYRKPAEIGLVIDPFIARSYPDELKTHLDLLHRAGVDYGITGVDNGSGAQFFELGFRDIARTIAEQTLQDIQSGGYSTLVFLSPYDFKAFRAWYPELGLETPQHVTAVPLPTYLLELIRGGKLSFRNKQPRTVTYHDASHFVRPQSRFLDIEKLLQSVPEVTYKPMWNSGRKADSDAGDFLPFTYPDIAQGINAHLLDEVKQTGAEMVLTSCFYALHNLRQVAQPGDPKVSDLGTFLADYL